MIADGGEEDGRKETKDATDRRHEVCKFPKVNFDDGVLSFFEKLSLVVSFHRSLLNGQAIDSNEVKIVGLLDSKQDFSFLPTRRSYLHEMLISIEDEA